MKSLKDIMAALGEPPPGGAVESAVSELAGTPQGKLVVYALDALDGLVSFKTGIDFPNGQQILAFVGQLSDNWSFLAAAYADDWSNGHAWARQDTAVAMWTMTGNAGWPCSSRIALSALVVQRAFPGKKAGSKCVKSWVSRLGLLLDGKPAPYWDSYSGGKETGQMKMCQPGGIASSLGPLSKNPVAAGIVAGSPDYWESYQSSKDLAAGIGSSAPPPMTLEQLQAVAKGLLVGGKINIMAGAMLVLHKQVQLVAQMVAEQAAELEASPVVPAASSSAAFADALGPVGAGETRGGDTPSAAEWIAVAAALAALAR